MAAPNVLGDFNGDEFADLAVAAPGEDVGTVRDAGAVNVLYGTASGLSAAGDQIWHQDSPGVLDAAEPGDRFGAALAAGDFNNDGIADLAVGAPDEDVGTVPDAGAVNVLYGTPLGLHEAGDQLWNQNSAGVLDAAEPGDRFGAALAAGDFNGNVGGRVPEDLAVGVPDENVGSVEDAGAVNVLYGTPLTGPSDPGGLSEAGDQIWHQNRTGILDLAEPGDHFGVTVATGDLNGDLRAELAVGVPDEDIGTVPDAGAVNVLYGTSGGLSEVGDQLWHQNRPGVIDAAEPGDAFGAALAGGDFDEDGLADLAVGAPDEDVGTISDAGAVDVLYGSADGLAQAGDQFWHQDSVGVLDAAEPGDRFGVALAAGSFDGAEEGQSRATADLAVGVDLENVGSVEDAGAVNVLYDTASGLSEAGDQIWHQNSAGVLDAAEPGDRFGLALATGEVRIAL